MGSLRRNLGTLDVTQLDRMGMRGRALIIRKYQGKWYGVGVSEDFTVEDSVVPLAVEICELDESTGEHTIHRPMYAGDYIDDLSVRPLEDAPASFQREQGMLQEEHLRYVKLRRERGRW
jgi:hypothetical protein